MEALQDSHDPDSLESLLTEVQREVILLALMIINAAPS